MSWLHYYLLKHFALYRKFVKWVRYVKLPGFKGVPLASVLLYFFRSLSKDDLGTRASAMAFNFFLSLFPAVIFFFTTIAYIPLDDFHNDIMLYFNHVLPRPAYDALAETLLEILNQQHGGLLSLGFFAALIFASNAVYNMFQAFNSYEHAVETRSTWHRRWLSLSLTLIISALFILSTVIIIFGQQFLDWLVVKKILTTSLLHIFLSMFQWVLILLLYFMVIAFVYHLGSSVHRKFKLFTPGGTLAAVCSILATIGFGYYINNFNNYNKLYGSIGTLLIVLMLIYFNSLIILFGYELNVSIEKALDSEIKPENITAEKLNKAG